MDTFTPSERSAIMRKVRGKDTTPELRVQALVRKLGLGPSLHRRDLPGNPDLVFTRRRKVIFVHGCFWHGHSCRAGKNRPSSRRAYWIPKLDRNKARDAANRRRLRRQGWSVLTVWECQLKDATRLESRLAKFLVPES